MKTNTITLFLLLSYATIVVVAIFFYPRWQQERTNATLSWDVSGYYFYLPSFFIYEDAKQLTFKDEIIKKYQPSSSFYQAFRHEASGNYVMKYSIGQAALYSPFFLIAHIHAQASDYPSDGFSYPYQFWISWGSIFVAFWGLWIMGLVLRRYFSATITGMTLLLLVVGTNYLNYTAIDHAMTHNYLFTLYALMIYATMQFYKKRTYRWAAAIGIILGLAALTRPTEIIMALIPLLWGIKTISERVDFYQKEWTKMLVAAVVTIAIGSLQLIYWKYATGDWIVYSYQDQGFSWLKPHLYEGFLSYRKGWLVYTPLMVFSVIGFWYLYQQRRSIFWACLAFFLINTYIVFAWDIWWYGGSLGQRAMVQSYAVLLFPLAAFFTYLQQQNWWKKLLVSAAILLFVAHNITLTYQAHGGGLDAENMTKAYFWRIFLNWEVQKMDKKLLDSSEDYQGERADIRTIFFEDFENLPDTLVSLSSKQAYEGKRSIVVWRDRSKSDDFVFPLSNEKVSEKWLRASAKVFAPTKEWDKWNMCQFIVQFRQGKQVIKSEMVRIFRFYDQGYWGDAFIDLTVPTQLFDNILVNFDNVGSDKEVFIDNLQLELFNEK